MNTPTFKEQFDKITRAYMSDELHPFDECACFIGNLLNGESGWCFVRQYADKGRSYLFDDKKALGYASFYIRQESGGLYSPEDILKMENNFLFILDQHSSKPNEINEEKLFLAMDSTLDMLRKIHESKGEVIETFEFKKRELQPA